MEIDQQSSPFRLPPPPETHRLDIYLEKPHQQSPQPPQPQAQLPLPLPQPQPTQLQQAKGRARSNSKVYNNQGSSQTHEVLPPITVSKPILASHEASPKSATTSFPDSNAEQHPQFAREKFVFVVSLVSLNGTFERKTLSIPQAPAALKLGRPNTTQRAPSPRNGYFDSRVISREHAQLSVKEGKLYIRDLKSANGTFLNGEGIKEEKELHVGDNFELGIDITNDGKHQHQQQQHLKISCKVEGFLSIPIDGTVDVNEVLSNVQKDYQSAGAIDENITPPLSLFDAAMFGDVNNDLEDVGLGLSHDYLSGGFPNSNIGTSPGLISTIRMLIDQVHTTKLNNMKLESVEGFLEEYKTYLNRDRGLVKHGQAARQKVEIKELEGKVQELESYVLQKENDLRQSRLDLSLQESKVAELEKTVKTLTNSNLDYKVQVKMLKDFGDKKEKEIGDLRKNEEILIQGYQSEVDLLNEKIKQQDGRIAELQRYKDDSQRQQAVVDMAHLSLIFISLLCLGMTILYSF